MDAHRGGAARSANEFPASSDQRVRDDVQASMPANMQFNWGFQSEGFQISVSFRKGEFAAEEAIQAVVITRNVSDRRLFYVSEVPHYLEFLVVDQSGRRVPTRSELQQGTSSQKRVPKIVNNPPIVWLLSGEQGEEIVDLRKRFDLPAGKYTVSVSRMVSRIDDPYKKSEVLSGNAPLNVIASSAPRAEPKQQALSEANGNRESSQRSEVGVAPQNPKQPSVAAAQDSQVKSQVAEVRKKAELNGNSTRSSVPAAIAVQPMSNSQFLLYGLGVLTAIAVAGIGGYLVWRRASRAR